MITRREQQILDLAEGGMEAAAISAELGVSEGYVSGILKRLLCPAGSNASFDEMQRRGSAALLAAIAQHHPEQIGAAR